jgi:hypothetical protein
MSSRLPFRACVFLVGIVPFTSGCLSFHDYRSVGVLVRDAETKKPISGAEVSLSYPLASSPFAPFGSSGNTGKDGIIHLRAVPNEDTGLRLETTAKGYQPEDQRLSVEAVRKMAPAPWYEFGSARPADLVVELYAEPSFYVELVVPVGFRGLIKTSTDIDETVTCPIGERGFRYAVPTSGEVVIKGPARVLQIYAPAYRCKVADGTVLDSQMDSVKVGFRWLSASGASQFFVVGTELEYQHFLQDVPSEVVAPKSGSGGGGGKGGGRGGHRQSGGDTTSQ